MKTLELYNEVLRATRRKTLGLKSCGGVYNTVHIYCMDIVKSVFTSMTVNISSLNYHFPADDDDKAGNEASSSQFKLSLDEADYEDDGAVGI